MVFNSKESKKMTLGHKLVETIAKHIAEKKEERRQDRAETEAFEQYLEDNMTNHGMIDNLHRVWKRYQSASLNGAWDTWVGGQR